MFHLSFAENFGDRINRIYRIHKKHVLIFLFLIL